MRRGSSVAGGAATPDNVSSRRRYSSAANNNNNNNTADNNNNWDQLEGGTMMMTSSSSSQAPASYGMLPTSTMDIHNAMGNGAGHHLIDSTYSSSSSSVGLLGSSPMSSGIFVDDSQGKSRRRHKQGFLSGLLTSNNNNFNISLLPDPDTVQVYAGGLCVITLLLVMLLPSIELSLLTLVYGAVLFGILVSLWLARVVLQCDEGTMEMRNVSNPIRQGATGFLHVQYTAIAKFAVPLMGLIVLSYQFRPSTNGSHHHETKGVALLGNTMLGLVAALGFALGATSSAVSGYVSMWVAAQSNIRVASASRRSYGEALVVCFRGGAFSAVLNLTLCIAGVTLLFTILRSVFASAGGRLQPTDVPMLLVGYGFGASFVALFMQLGGGIYTKAADVGADLVGKVEQSIPEDDPRNPAGTFVTVWSSGLRFGGMFLIRLLFVCIHSYCRSRRRHGGRLCWFIR